MNSNNGFRYKFIRAVNILEAELKALKDARSESLHISCINCNYWDKPNELCGLYRARPPAEVIAYACQDWGNLEEDVPF